MRRRRSDSSALEGNAAASPAIARRWTVAWTVAMLSALLVIAPATVLAARGQAPRPWALRLGDGFLLAGTQIGCEVSKSTDRSERFDSLFCFERAPTGPVLPKSVLFRPARGTYLLVLDELGVAVVDAGKDGRFKSVVSVRQPSASAADLPKGAATARPIPTGFGELRRGRLVYVVGTHIVCNAIGAKPTLVCYSFDHAGPVVGSYLATISDSRVFLGRLAPGATTRVFSRATRSG